MSSGSFSSVPIIVRNIGIRSTDASSDCLLVTRRGGDGGSTSYKPMLVETTRISTSGTAQAVGIEQAKRPGRRWGCGTFLQSLTTAAIQQIDFDSVQIKINT